MALAPVEETSDSRPNSKPITSRSSVSPSRFSLSHSLSPTLSQQISRSRRASKFSFASIASLNLYDSFSSFSSLDDTDKVAFVESIVEGKDNDNIFQKKTTHTERPFSLKDLEVGGVSPEVPNQWMGNRLHPGTRQENRLLGFLLSRLNKGRIPGGEKVTNEKELFEDEAEEYLKGKLGSTAFDKLVADVMRLLESRFDDRSHLAMEAERMYSTKKVVNTVVIEMTPQEYPQEYENNKQGMMRLPMRVIRKQLDNKIELLQTIPAEWDMFEQKIGLL
jgi:hypothetical protein